MIFIAFNATVVFDQGLVRWLGLMAFSMISLVGRFRRTVKMKNCICLLVGLLVPTLVVGARTGEAAKEPTGEPIVLLNNQRLQMTFGQPKRILEKGLQPYLFLTPKKA